MKPQQDLFAPTALQGYLETAADIAENSRQAASLRQRLLSQQQSLLPDSGARTEFATGAVRENKAGKGRFADIPPCALTSLAKRFQDGEPAHGRGNWMKGIPLSSYQDAVTRHTMEIALGHTNEDHFGAALWNLACWQWTEQEIAAGRLPKELDDLPFRRVLSRNEYGSLSGGPTEKETPL